MLVAAMEDAAGVLMSPTLTLTAAPRRMLGALLPVPLPLVVLAVELV
jgi:hypothetical protein